LSKLVARLRTSADPGVEETVDSLVEQIASAEAHIKAVTTQLHQIDGAVVIDGG
jgi:hypothetical protein